MTTTDDIVQKLWNLCHILRDDGVTYHQYVTELTYLLFLKLAEEKSSFVERQIPDRFRWRTLRELDGLELFNHYRRALTELGTDGTGLVAEIFKNASTSVRQPKHLHALVTNIEQLDWYSAKEEGAIGELYEGLLKKNADEVKSGAGQYFTPRPLIESIIELVKPMPGERIQDPAAGTGGFLIAADRYMRNRTDRYYKLPLKQRDFQVQEALLGVELVPDVYRLALMNALLHDIEGTFWSKDTLATSGEKFPSADVMLTNPPFGTKKGGGGPTRDDILHPTSNKQLVFLQHIYRGLKPGGRAAVVLPDNVLFEEGVGQRVRADLMDKCDLHTILRLPTGIFYAQGVKTNVLFFTRGEKKVEKGNTKAVWFYDLRTNAPSFGKRTPLTRDHFKEFEKAYGADPHGKSKRKDQGEAGRFRKFKREEIAKRGDNLDISWLKDDSVTDHADLPEPEVIAAQIVAQLQIALEEMQALQEELGGGQ